MDPYRYSLSLTTQFYFCSLPLRLDSYSRCQFGCHYCFAKARGGNTASGKITAADPDRLERRLERVAGGRVASVVDEFLVERQALHFGGMSDPFMPLERTAQRSLSLLQLFVDLITRR